MRISHYDMEKVHDEDEEDVATDTQISQHATPINTEPTILAREPCPLQPLRAPQARHALDTLHVGIELISRSREFTTA
jgi:hypothetical protein